MKDDLKVTYDKRQFADKGDIEFNFDLVQP